uniref:Ig-like domain-containing protein n=1 Tax=Gopherus agassizii TaxID=38772 RepID=A0A452I8I1_9SAUR
CVLSHQVSFRDCWGQVAWVESGQVSVEQSPEWRGVSEEQNGTMTCTYSCPITRLYWYRQDPGERPLFLPQENATEQRFMGQPLEDGKRSSLHITDSQLGDSGSYLCAVRAQ